LHLAIFLFAHAACFLTGVFPKPVILYGMVENGTELAVYGAKIDRGILFTAFIGMFHQFILPCDNLMCSDVVHFELAKVGKQFCADDMFFGSPCVFFQTGFRILRVTGYKALKGHIQIG